MSPHESLCRHLNRPAWIATPSSLNRSGRFRQSFTSLISLFFTLHSGIYFIQQLDKGNLRLCLSFPEVEMFAQLEECGQPGFQLDFRRSVLVFSQSLDEMTQAQSLDLLQVQFPAAP